MRCHWSGYLHLKLLFGRSISFSRVIIILECVHCSVYALYLGRIKKKLFRIGKNSYTCLGLHKDGVIESKSSLWNGANNIL